MFDPSMDLVIVAFVVGLRIAVPLFIPRFPIPAILAAMIVDAADQTLFENNTAISLRNYQSYDKALDVYYLAIAFLSTMRNWTNQAAFNVGRLLWYYRLVGVALFEMTLARPLLVIFPNTFEYFFDFYEGVRLRWDPRKLARRAIILVAAAIWIVIKLPQEYWIHIARIDTTDQFKEEVFGASVDTPTSDLIVDHFVVFGVGGCLLAGFGFLLSRIARQRLPPAGWPVAFDSDARRSEVSHKEIALQYESMRRQVLSIELVEKIILLSLVTIIFTRIIPGTRSDPLEETATIAVFLLATTLMSEVMQRWRDHSPKTAFGVFVTTFAINSVIVFGIREMVVGKRTFNTPGAIFFVFLLSVLIALYDHYRPIYLARFGDKRLEKRFEKELRLFVS